MKLIDAIELINQDIGEVDELYIHLSYRTDGINECVKYLGSVIWSSSDDDREWFEDKNEYEPFETFLKRKVNNINKIIGNIKVNCCE